MESTDHIPVPDRDRRSSLRGLVALNAILLVILAAVTFGSHAEAQGRGRGDYTMVGGGVNGAQSSAVYIVDAANQELVAIAYDVNNKSLAGIGYRNLASDTAIVMRRRPGN